MSEKRPALPALTGLRFFLAMLVVLSHFGTASVAELATMNQGVSALLGHLAFNGYAAVPVFFALSGFVLAYSYLTPDAALRGSIERFYRARLGRIYPAYLLGFMLALVPLLWWGALPTDQYGAAFRAHPDAVLLAVLGLLQSWVPWWNEVVNPPAWSLSVEACFYVSFPFVAPQLVRSRWAWPLVLALWLGTKAPALAGWSTLGPLALGPLLFVPEFYAGVLVGYAFRRGWRLPTWLLLPASIALPCSFLTAQLLPYALVHAGGLDPLILLSLAALADPRGAVAQALAHPAWQLLGEVSYALYILHWPVWLWFTRYLPYHPGNSAIAYFVLYAICATGLAVAVFLAVERPVRGWIMRMKRARSGVSALRVTSDPRVA